MGERKERRDVCIDQTDGVLHCQYLLLDCIKLQLYDSN